MANIFVNETRAVLALRKVDAPDEVALAAVVIHGLPLRSVEHIVELGIPEKELYRFIPRRALERRRRGCKLLTAAQSGQIERLAVIFALAKEVFGDSARAVSWLLKPKRRFSSMRPIDLIHSWTGAGVVENVLLQAYFGFAA